MDIYTDTYDMIVYGRIRLYANNRTRGLNIFARMKRLDFPARVVSAGKQIYFENYKIRIFSLLNTLNPTSIVRSNRFSVFTFPFSF